MPGANLATAYVQIVPSAQGIGGALRNIMDGEASAAGSSAGKAMASKIKGAIVAAGIGTALVGGLKTALQEGANLQQSYLGGLDTLYGDAADQARRYADEAAKAGVSQNSFAEQAVSFGAALKQAYGGDTQKAMEAANTAILDMADNSAKMGTPLQSIQDAYQSFAKGQYVLLDNLKLGYGGTKTEMERLLADAEKLTGQKYDIDNLGDVYDAIHAIQKDLGLAGVAADEAATTFSGSLGAMKAAYENLMGNMMLGQNVEPAMKAFAESASNFLFNNFVPAIGNIFSSLPAAISTFIQTGAPQLAAAGMQLVKSMAEGAKASLPVAISTILNGMVGMSGKLRQGFAKFVDVGLQMVKSIADGIIKNIPTFIQTVPKIITNIAGLINDNAPKILETGVSIIKSLAVGLVKAIPVLVESIPQIVTAIIAVFEAVQWANIGKFAVSGIAKGMKKLIGKVKEEAKKIADKIKAPINAIPSKIGGAIAAIRSKLSFPGLKGKVKAAFDAIKEKITEPIRKAKDKVKEIVNKIKGFFPISLKKLVSFSLPTISIGSKSTKVGDKNVTSPTFGVGGWRHYAKAMSRPFLFDREKVFGLVAGEGNRHELMYGHDALMSDIESAVASSGQKQDVYNFYGDIIFDASNLDDVATLEQLIALLRRAKGFAA